MKELTVVLKWASRFQTKELSGIKTVLIYCCLAVFILTLWVHIRGVGSVVGCVLVQLVIGSYHGTFGNLLPYFASYIRQVG